MHDGYDVSDILLRLSCVGFWATAVFVYLAFCLT